MKKKGSHWQWDQSSRAHDSQRMEEGSSPSHVPSLVSGENAYLYFINFENKFQMHTSGAIMHSL